MVLGQTLLPLSVCCSDPRHSVMYNKKVHVHVVNISRLCSVGYSQTVPGVFTPGITLRRTSVSSVGHSYPYPELLEVLYDIYTRTRNFWKCCTPVRTIPGVRVQHFYTRSELL